MNEIKSVISDIGKVLEKSGYVGTNVYEGGIIDVLDCFLSNDYQKKCNTVVI